MTAPGPRTVYALVDARAVPLHDHWLSEGERAVVARLRVPSRRWHWRLGRWTAKQTLVGLGVAPASAMARLEIRAAADGAPEAALDGRRLPGTLSLSHRAGRGLCLASLAATPLGCDLEWIEARSDAFVADFFTEEERMRIAAARPIERLLLVTLLWSAKESTLKALRVGLRADTRAVRVAPALAPTVAGWCPFRAVVTLDGVRTFDGWWRQEARHVLTVVTAPGGGPPCALRVEGDPGASVRRSAVRL